MMKRQLRYSSNHFAPLNQNSQHRLANSHAFSLYRKNAIYSFIPKNACSTMRASIARANGCIRDETDIHWIHQNNQTFIADLGELIRAEYTFVILRCPFARLASVYLDKIISKSDLVAHDIQKLMKWSIDIDEISFSDFVELMENPGIRIANRHWRPQIDFLVYEEYDDYFCLEDFEFAVKTLKEKIDLDIMDARPITLHGTAHLDKITSGDFSKTSTYEIYSLRREGKSPTTTTLYDDKSVETVARLFRKDIEIYKNKFGTDTLSFDV